MSLADELLADLEEAEQEDEQLISVLDTIDEIEEVTEDAMDESTLKYDRVTTVARLRNSERFFSIIEKIENEIALNARNKDIRGPVEADPEYQLIVEANNLAVDIDNELNVIHKFVRDKYAKRFPELESLVPMPLEYISCVKELGNEILEKSKNSETLQNILLPATVIVVSVTASTTQGESLTDDELSVVLEACSMALELNEAKLKIYEYVESRMGYIAPNLTSLVGAGCAAKLIGVAGGLTQLSKMPACNLQVLGAQKKTLSGFSTTAIMPHTGFIFFTPIVQSLPPDLRHKAMRLIAAKCTLAARIDAVHSYPDGSLGIRLLEEIEQKLEKMQEPPPVKHVKALPKPLDAPSKKRGGRRVRKMKERLGISDMRAKANRMNFGDIEEDVLQDDIGFTLGQLKSKAGGRIRAPQVDDKTRVRMSKALQRNLQRQQAGAGGGASTVRHQSKVQLSGTASSVTFTPVQGLEIINPNAAEYHAGTKSTYFSTTSGFRQLGGLQS